MTTQTVFTLVHPQTGRLAFQIAALEDTAGLEQVQRLPYYAILLVTEGVGKVQADFSTYDFSGPTLLFFSLYQPHQISSQGAWKGWRLNFHPDFFCIHKHQKEVACNGVLFNNIYQAPLMPLNSREAANFSQLFEQMQAEMQQSELAQYELLVSYLKILLINATRLKVQQQPEAQRAVADRKEPFILQTLKDAIEQHYRQLHSASSYADLLNISTKALAKLSKVHFNKTLTDLIAERIVIEAKRELYLTSKPVKSIAYELGFSDEYYFSRFFKNNADVSPQQFRENVGFARAE
jgi:AraC-like DNA-binding protein